MTTNVLPLEDCVRLKELGAEQPLPGMVWVYNCIPKTTETPRLEYWETDRFADRRPADQVCLGSQYVTQRCAAYHPADALEFLCGHYGVWYSVTHTGCRADLDHDNDAECCGDCKGRQRLTVRADSPAALVRTVLDAMEGK